MNWTFSVNTNAP